MTFLDNKTRKALFIDEVLSVFQPLTPMGKNKKNQLVPFLPGQEAEWQKTLSEQEEIKKKSKLSLQN